jgi:DNA-directed RNA polymerase subunit RPC12/RpoP
LATLNPELAKEWHPTKNGDITPYDVGAGCTKKFYWLCSICGSMWYAAVFKRNRGNNCPYCAGRKVNNKNCFATKEPKLLREWDFSRNKNISPYEITSGSNILVYWICEKKHSWMAAVSDRTGKDRTGCPYCSNRKIDENNCLAKLNPELALDWDYEKNQGVTPNDVGANSQTKAKWKCHICGNEWAAIVMHRNHGYYRCKRCHSLGNKYPELIDEWDFKKNKTDPFLVAPSSNKKYSWVCYDGHEWMAKVSARTNGKTNCPYCEKVILKDGTVCDSYVEAFFYLEYKKQNIFFKHNEIYDIRFGKYRYDFYFPEFNKYVEVTSTNPRWIRLVGRKRWNKYRKTIKEKREFVENELEGIFEFIQMNLNNEQMELVRKNMRNKK